MALLAVAFALVSMAQSGSALDGAWVFTMDTDGGVRTVESNFVVTVDQVTGKWGNTDVKGTFNGEAINLSFPMTSDEGGISATVKITGKLQAGTLSGRWEFGDYGGTYTAKKKS